MPYARKRPNRFRILVAGEMRLLWLLPEILNLDP
jgi:hypothetical protein